MLKANYIYDTGKVQTLVLILILGLALVYFTSSINTTVSSVALPVLKTTPVVDTTFTIIHPTN
jgi:hypothetical protein